MTGKEPASQPDPTLDQILAEYLRSVEQGRPLAQQQLIKQHPDLADELRSFFANRAALERLAEPLQGSAYDATIDVGRASSLSSDEQQRQAGSLPHEKVRYFGDYELLEELGRGGMGVVYQARQSTLNRLVALKMILSGQLASANDVQRFKQEACLKRG